MSSKGYCLRSRQKMDKSQALSDGQMELEVNVETASGSGRSAVMSVADEMELLRLKLKIAEAELAKERLRSESSAPASPSAQRAPVGTEEDRRLRVTSMLKGVLVAMPSQEALVPGWFDDAEATFDAYEVPPQWRAGLILPHLSERARGVLTRLSADERKNYELLKEAVLKGLRLSSAEYRRLFTQSKRKGNETWGQFATRLDNYFTYYMNSYKVNSVEELRELVVADRLRGTLNPEACAFVMQNEENGKPPRLHDIADLAEKFEESQRVKGGASVGGDVGGSLKAYKPFVNTKRPPGEDAKTKGGPTRPRRECYVCRAPDHFARDCPTAKSEQANLIRTVAGDKGLVARVAGETLRASNVDVGDSRYPAIKTIGLGSGASEFTGHLDSGAEISVIRRSVLKEPTPLTGGKIMLTGAFGEQVVADLAYVPLRLTGTPEYVGYGTPDAGILCAVTDKLAAGIDALINPDAHAQLLEETPERAAAPPVGDGEEEREGEADPDGLVAAALVQENGTVESGPEGENELPGESKREQLRKAQLEDPTLRDAWEQSRARTHGMIEREGLLFHRDEIAGRSCLQLVLPEQRRKEVLCLAHDSTWAGHLGEKKTLQRIKGAFFWPGISADVKRYCQSCHQCQVKSNPRVRDRVPIAPIARPDTPFQVVNMDCIGPIDPPSARGHRYALCVIDHCTRWPEVVCLRSLTAKATCDALLGIFSRMGVPETICSDQGTNFTARLTREFLARMGATPRFSTPEHPESNGLVERFNGTFKSMLFDVVQTYGRDWDRHVPFLLWAYREVPNATTKESPFELMYGRAPVGPLTLLMKTWSGEWAVPDSLNTSTEEYLRQLKEGLMAASERATVSSQVAQEKYTSNYNLRARPKQFYEGDMVLVQETDTVGKLAAKWLGPAKVVSRERPYTYLVDLGDRGRRSVHANKLRPYITRVNVVGVIFEDDKEFGEIPTAPNRCSTQMGELGVFADHLSASQVDELRHLINKHRSVFSDKPGTCKLGVHKIRLREGCEPKRSYNYRVPLALQSEVTRQVEELVEWGLVYPTQSQSAHPIVCVTKRDGGMRLCVDYRQLNAVTQPDAFPMGRATELLYEVAGSSYITVIDMLRGYWQIPLDEEAQQHSAFVTHQGQYAWRVMPYGLRNSASTFQRLMNELLAPHREYACAYIDDVAVHSRTWEEHLQHLDKVLTSIAAAGLTANVSKCKFAQTEVRYLGHIVGSGRHAPDPERIAALQDCPRPTTKRELRSFLGLANYYRDYVANYSAVVLPLTEMTNRRVTNPLPWTEKAESAFRQIKQCLAEASALRAPNVGEEYILATDASEFAIGACLSQVDDEGREHPIAFLSKKLSPAQTKWATIEREAYAIIWALQRMEAWLFGAKVRVVTDHNPLKFLTLTSPQSARLTRWALALQKFNVTIEHKKGALNTNADALSRLVAPAP